MTTQLPNGYEAVKNIPATVTRIHLSETSHGLAVNDGARILQVIGAGYTLLGRADELTEEEVKDVVDTKIIRVPSPSIRGRYNRIANYINYLEKYGDSHGCLTALESFNSLLASLNLKPDTTVIIKKEK